MTAYTQTLSSGANQAHLRASLPRLNAIRTGVVFMMAFGYASTMPFGPDAEETFKHLGYEPSWICIQILFFFSGVLAMRSVQSGRTGWLYLASRFWRNGPLLLAFTLAMLAILFPLFGTPADSGLALLKRLSGYIIITVSCLDPGRPLPGLMDSARYMCLVQGAIWTLRWGLLLHLITAFIGRWPRLRTPKFSLILAIFTTLSYACVTFLAVKLQRSELTHLVLFLRLTYPFLIGMSIWAYRRHLPQSFIMRGAVASGLLAFAWLNHSFAPWTPFIEISLCMFWGYGTWLLATSTTQSLSVLNHWPHLALGLFLANWPVAQTLLLINPDLGRWTLPMVSLPLSLVISILTHMAITGRLHHWIGQRLDAKIAVKPTRS